MPNIVEIVETQLKVAGTSAYNNALSSVSRTAGMAGRAIDTLTSLVNPLSVALAGVGLGMTAHAVAEVNSQFEESQRLIAGIFTTMGMAGDFNQGLAQAAQTMDMITVAAARLPGEAEDYINVFQTGLTVVQQTFRGSTEEMTDFTNQYTAIMSTLGVHSAEAGFSLVRALASGRGQIDQQSMAFQRLLPFIQQATRGTQRQVTSIQQFNALTQQQRGEVLRATLAQEGLVAMLDDAGTSWNAQTGALASIVRMMGRMATSPLFDAMKDWLGQFNALFMDGEGQLTSFGATLTTIGSYISEVLVAGVNNLIEFIGPGVDALSELGKGLSDILSPIFAQLASVGSETTGFLDAFWPTVQVVTENVLAFIDAMRPIATILIDFGQYVFRAHVVIAQRLYPTFMELWYALTELWHSISDLLAPIAFLVTGTTEATMGLDFFILTIEIVVRGLTAMIEAITWFNRQFNIMSGGQATADFLRGQQGREEGIYAAMQRRAAEDAAKAESRRREAGRGGGAVPPPPGARPGTSVHQDFRHSRFDITQRFQEGFDPDRIAVAFADDVGRIGEQRLQSGLEPIFGVR